MGGFGYSNSETAIACKAKATLHPLALHPLAFDTIEFTLLKKLLTLVGLPVFIPDARVYDLE